MGSSARSNKAWTLPGSIGALPIGLYEAVDFPNIALVEGGPDLLAAFHLAWCATSTPETLALGKGIDVVGNLGVVAMLGGPPILEGELRHFKDKCVRIFADADEPGPEAEGRWWHQLESAGAKVDGYSFAGFIRSDGSRSRISTISRSSTLTNGRRNATPSRRHSHFQTERKQ